MNNFALQLWTLDNETSNDFPGTLKKVSEFGYTGVEFAGFKDVAAKDMKKYLDEYGLKAVGSHVGASSLTDSLEETIEYNSIIGNKYIIVPSYGFEGMESVKTLVEILNSASVKAAEYGMKIGFHNHSEEFKKIDGKYILDIIADETAENVIIEPDVYWIMYSGVNPYEYIKKLGKKAELVHLKQIGSDGEAETLFDEGIIDLAKVVETACFAKDVIVEYEGDVDRLTAAKLSADFLKNISILR